MEAVSVKDLLEAGAHFGHTTSRWNPKMKPYLFGKQNYIHIIDIKQTLKGFLTAYHYLRELARRNGTVVFVGTKRQAQNVVKNEATRCGMPYVSERWLGGTLTNFDTVRSRVKRLLELEAAETDGSLQKYNKKELSMLRRELNKLRTNLSGIKNMSRLPQVLVVVDYKTSKIAITEAKKAKIKTIGLIDTDGDPTSVDIAIPINDDAERVIQIILAKLADAVLAGKAEAPQVTAEVTQFNKEATVEAVKPTRRTPRSRDGAGRSARPVQHRSGAGPARKTASDK